MEMKKCLDCGQEIASTEEVCPKCGANFADIEEEVKVVTRAQRIADARKQPSPTPEPAPTPQPQPAKKKTSLFASLARKKKT